MKRTTFNEGQAVFALSRSRHAVKICTKTEFEVLFEEAIEGTADET